MPEYEIAGFERRYRSGSTHEEHSGDAPTPGKRTLVEQVYGHDAASSRASADPTIPGKRTLVETRDAGPASEPTASARPALPPPHAGFRLFGKHQRLIDGRPVQNVSGDGMSCLINAILTATGLHTDERAQAARRYLVEQGVAEHGELLDLAGHAGQKLLAYLRSMDLITADRGVVAWHYQGTTLTSKVVVPGANPVGVLLHMAERHFSAVMDR